MRMIIASTPARPGKENADSPPPPAATTTDRNKKSARVPATTPSSSALRTCSSCQATQGKDCYSKSQWKKRPGVRKCKSCVVDLDSAPAAALGDVTNSSGSSNGDAKSAPPKADGGKPAAEAAAVANEDGTSNNDAKKKEEKDKVKNIGTMMDIERLTAALSFSPNNAVANTKNKPPPSFNNNNDGECAPNGGQEEEDDYDDMMEEEMNFTFETPGIGIGSGSPTPTNVVDATTSSVFGMALYEAEVSHDHVRMLLTTLESTTIDDEKKAWEETLTVSTDALNLPCFKASVLDEMFAPANADNNHNHDPSQVSYLRTQLICAAAGAEVKLGLAGPALDRIERAASLAEEEASQGKERQQYQQSYQQGKEGDFPTMTLSMVVEMASIAVEALRAVGKGGRAEELEGLLTRMDDGSAEGLLELSSELGRLCQEEEEAEEATGNDTIDGEVGGILGALDADDDGALRAEEGGDDANEDEERVGEDYVDDDAVVDEEEDGEEDVVSVVLDDEAGEFVVHVADDSQDDAQDKADDVSTRKVDVSATAVENTSRSTVVPQDNTTTSSNTNNAEAAGVHVDLISAEAPLYEEVLATLLTPIAPKSAPARPADVTQTIYHAYKSAYGMGKSVAVLGPILGLTESAASAAIRASTLGNMALTDVDESVVTPQLRGIDDFVLNPVISAVGGAVHMGEEAIDSIVRAVASAVMGPFGFGK